jgi:hypothetical protein
VIVGVGSADFGPMQFLDDVNSGANGVRDIVQFVPFNQHAHSSQSLTNATLAEIPGQVEGYFRSRNIAPLPAIRLSDSQITADGAENEIDLSLDIRGEQEISISSGGHDFVNGFKAP